METETDYYELLGIEITASADDIKKAYRKKALKVHPDKNPSPDAAVLFHALTQAQDLLLDTSRRNDYDQKHRARQEQRREHEAKRAKTEQQQAKAQYEAELARLREEGAKRRQEDWVTEPKEKEPGKIDMRIGCGHLSNLTELPPETERDCALKFKWSSKHRLSEKDVEELLRTVANVDTVALSQKKKRCALAVFKTVVDAYTVITKKETHPSLSKFETIEWAAKKPPPLVEKMIREEEMRRQARAALFAVDNRPQSKSDKPLFSVGTQPSFFKAMNIPAFKVSGGYLIGIHR
ncbi:uncharacterized protein B0P05DRAFT_524551 [Gilbertella persicaria]|uniref:uncharacterized protein n=1 Tax=Gilbertella persicaria TaxID=101096 RepID=UPI00222025D9|nr:uncharacterized protein B0P05DRAFT_524551 [Gilbertella persicaria]KAI8095063.1 hypothetical protein B0P05DRAFT_524551 [Gilbertella persicaria]